MSTGLTLDAGYPLPQVYCADEDVALRCGDDYPALAPSSQVQAQGVDGAFAAGFPWVLTSASIDFLAAGVHARQVIHLTWPATQFPGAGALLAVDGVSTDGTALNLRRLGMAPGKGQPPAPAAGLAAVRFAVRTFDPQIDKVSYDANKVFNINQGDPQYRSSLVTEPREVQQWVVLSVLRDAYLARLKERREDFGLKLEEVRRELSDLKGRVQVRWGALGLGAPPSPGWGAQMRR